MGSPEFFERFREARVLVVGDLHPADRGLRDHLLHLYLLEHAQLLADAELRLELRVEGGVAAEARRPLVVQRDAGYDTILHELGHTLGLAHEHTRSDRDTYIQVLFENIKAHWHSAYTMLSTKNCAPYSFNSAMHYGTRGGSSNGNGPTMEVRPAYQQYASVLGQSVGLTQYDRLGVKRLYEGNCDGLLAGPAGPILFVVFFALFLWMVARDRIKRRYK